MEKVREMTGTSMWFWKVVSLSAFLFVSVGDSVEFLSWFLNSLHTCLGGTKKSKETVISRTFRGRMRIYSRKVPPIDMVTKRLCTFISLCTLCPDKIHPQHFQL